MNLDTQKIGDRMQIQCNHCHAVMIVSPQGGSFRCPGCQAVNVAASHVHHGRVAVHGYVPPGHSGGFNAPGMAPGSTTSCKRCRVPIGKSAKSCPQCGAPNKQHAEQLIAAIAIAVGLVLTCAVCVGSSDDERPGSSEEHRVVAPEMPTETLPSDAGSPARNAAVDDPTVIANELGAGTTGATHIRIIAERYGVPARSVGDKAARTAELCLGSTEDIGAQATRAVELAKASLAFVEGVSRTVVEREALPIDDAFVLFVTSGCPTGSKSNAGQTRPKATPDRDTASARRDIRAKGYTGFDSNGKALLLTDEEVAIAIDFGNALFRDAGGDEDKITRRIAKKHRVRVEVLDGIWSRANLHSDRRVLSHIGR